MDGGGGNPPASDQSQKELSIALAASSMINASDMISAHAYQANVQRIQEVKEMVRKLELNNEAAHRNFLVDQLEKRAKEGREAENMLAELRSKPRLPATAQFSNNIPSGDVLPTTATLVEVPDSHSAPSHSSLAPSITPVPPQSVQQSRPATYQWSNPQIQPYPDVIRHYVPQTTIHPSLQHSAAQHTQLPLVMGHWYTTQNPPPRPRVHNPSAQTGSQPIQVQYPGRTWMGYVPSAADVPSGYYPSAGERDKAPVPSAPSSSSSSLTHHGSGVSKPAVASRPPYTTHNQSLSSTPRVPGPSQSVPAVPVKPLAQISIGSYSKPLESRSQPVSTTVTTSGLQRSHEPPEQLQQHRQQPQPQLQQSQAQRPQSRVQQSQRSPQLPQSHQQPPPPSVDHVRFINASQLHTQPQPISVQEQSWQRDARMQQVDQAVFVKHFRDAVQRGVLQLQTFWLNAKAAGISEEWFRIAINSLPRNVWNAIVAQVNQSGNTLRMTPSANLSQQQVPVSNSNASEASAALPPTATSLGQMASTTQLATDPSIASKGDSTLRPCNDLYASQLQYYAEQAAKSANLAHTLGISTSSQGTVVPTHIAFTTPKRDAAPQVTANVRTPKDANKATLARDVLYALGKIVQKPSQETGGEPTDEANGHEGDKPPQVNISQSISRPASANSPATLLEPVLVETNPPTISSAEPNLQDVPQGDVSPSQLIVKPVSKAEPKPPDEGPIMIDLTLEDVDGSIDGKEQEPNFLKRTSTNAVISPRPVSPINNSNNNATNHNHTPLLENLSLEEPTVPLAGESDSSDIRMHSPALAISVEENVGLEPVVQSFETLPTERNEDELDGQLPLFLPSPPASPAPTEPPVTDFEEDEIRLPLKRRSVDVDEMEIDEEMEAPPRVRRRLKGRPYVFIPSPPLYVKKAKMRKHVMAEGRESDLEGVGHDEEFQYSDLEQLLIEESKSRLLERRCLWSNCGAILNSAANLLAHLKNHVREEALEAPFHCHWAGCKRQFGREQERDVHLERHTTKPLPCSFAGCDKQFNEPVEVMQHEVEHQKTERREPLVRKPICQPIVPAIPARLGMPPHWLPSHRVIPRRVAKCQISTDRHAVVGPWVLWNIFSPVDLNMRKQNASMRGRPTRQATNYDMSSLDPRHDDYDFLVAVSSPSTKEAPLDDIDSGAITISAARGLTLWGSVDAWPREEEEEVSRRQSREEDSVERMLTVS